MFSLTIPHTKENCKYAYSISSPNYDVKNYYIVSNDDNLQAVLDKATGLILLASWKDQIFNYKRKSYHLKQNYIYSISNGNIISEPFK